MSKLFSKIHQQTIPLKKHKRRKIIPHIISPYPSSLTHQQRMENGLMSKALFIVSLFMRV